MNLLNIFSNKTSNGLKLVKSNGQEWVVKNAYGVLYMGSKDMCKVFMQNTTLA
jgi:hypothetical protein